MGTTFSIKRKKVKLTLKRVVQNSELSLDKNDYIERKRKKKPRPPIGPPPKQIIVLDKPIEDDDSDDFKVKQGTKVKKKIKKVKIKKVIIKKVIIQKKKKPEITDDDHDEHEYVYDDDELLKEYDEDIFEYDLDEFTNTDNIKLL